MRSARMVQGAQMIKKVISILLLMFFIFSIHAQNNTETENPWTKWFEDQEEHERQNPAFMQKSGMLRANEHSFYIRTNDEWTGFSTFFSGYRYGINEYFNIAVEGGVSPIPYVFLGAFLLHFKLYETPKKFFFLGLRTRFGYKFQYHTNEQWITMFGSAFDNYLAVSRNGLYFAADLTAAFRFAKYKRMAIYYTIYPRFDFDFFDKTNPVFVLFSPVMVGFEIRFPKKRMRWSFAAEAGYTFPIPWTGVPTGQWVNFPSLANVTFSYRFGDKFYSKKNQEKYGIDLKEINIFGKPK